MIRNDLSEFEIDISQAKKDEFKGRVRKYVNSVINQLKERFPYVKQIASFCLFDPSRLPSSPSEMGTYGNRDLKILCDYYGGNGTADIKAEWEGFRFFMLQAYKQRSMTEH